MSFIGFALALAVAPLSAFSAAPCGVGALSPAAVKITAERRPYDPSKPFMAIMGPESSGRLLIPEARKRGYNILQIVFQPLPVALVDSLSNDYDVRIFFEGDIEATAREALAYAPKALVIGSELAAVAKDRLGHRLNELGLKLEVNEVELGVANKSRMAEVLARDGLAHIAEIFARTEKEAVDWIKASKLLPGGVVLKPTESAAGNGFHRCDNFHEVSVAFAQIMGQINILNRLNEGALVQPFIVGPELVPNLALREGRAILTDTWEYTKRTEVVNGKKVRLYKIDWLLDPKTDPRVRIVYDYVVAVSRSLKNSFGFAHPEVILDVNRGNRPTIVDYGARVMGGGQPRITEAATGHSQIDIGIDAMLNPEAFNRRYETQPIYELKKHAAIYSVMTFGNARASRRLENRILRLRSYFRHEFTYAEGEEMPGTEDMSQFVAQIELVHPDRRVVEEDLKLIEAWERNKRFESPLQPKRP